MAYIIAEFQTDTTGATACPPLVTKINHDEALQAFHQTASYAAVSSVPLHVVVLMSENGDVEKKEVCVHPVPEPEPEPDEEEEPDG